MEFITWSGILPLSFASLLTGLVLALGTKWGLFRPYWVLVKFPLTVLTVLVLLLQVQPISYIAAAAAAAEAALCVPISAGSGAHLSPTPPAACWFCP